MNSGVAFRMPIVVFVLLVLQDAVLRGMRIDGVRPDFLLGVTIVAAVVGGPERGAVVGFAAGMVADLFVATPMGMSALVWSVLGYAIGNLQSAILPQGRAAIPVTTFVGSGAGIVLFAFAGAVLGQPGMVTPRLLPIVLVVAVLNSLVSVPLARFVGWALSGGPDERSYAA